MYEVLPQEDSDRLQGRGSLVTSDCKESQYSETRHLVHWKYEWIKPQCHARLEVFLLRVNHSFNRKGADIKPRVAHTVSRGTAVRHRSSF